MGHIGGINRGLIVVKNKMLTCSVDKSIKVWDLKKKNCIRTIKMKESSECMAMFDFYYFFTGHSKEISLWNFFSEIPI